MEWKGLKRIISKYSSLPLFGSFNEGNGKFIPFFGSLSGKEWNWYKGTLVPFYFLKISNFHPSKLRGIGGNGIRFNDFFTKTPKIPLYIQLFILKWKSNNNIVIKWFHSILSMLLPNKITYIPFIFFPLF